MKALSAFVTCALLASANAHTIFQKVSVNGVDQGQLKGVRAPDSDYPIQNVNDANIACNTGITHKDNTIINVPAGAQVGSWWGHVIGGAQVPNDPDNPIAVSHKGPISVYLAKVDNAASTGTSGLKWFKIAHDGLSNGQWGVDRMISNGGWNYFTIPSCLASGNYLLRVELIALHSAYSAGGAQFYMECAQINVTGGGSYVPNNTVSFPGAYSANDPSIVISIYDSAGQPTNGGKTYNVPGPAPISCAGVPNVPPPPATPTAIPPPPPPTQPPTQNPPTGGAPLYGQCGGQGWSGATTCSQGICKVSNDYYSQCVPS